MAGNVPGRQVARRLRNLARSATMLKTNNYIARGWATTPVSPRSKKARLPDWPNRRCTAADFAANDNVGVVLGEASAWLIDVDLDHSLAVELAPQFLPATGSIFGRAGKQRSHWLYYADGATTHKRQAEPHGMLVELRSTGCQTVAPGSTHPSGELIEWSEDGEPARVNAADLRQAVDALADEVERRLGVVKQQPIVSLPAYQPSPASSDVLSRATAYVASVPGCSEGSRNDAAFRLSAVLVNDFLLPEQDAWQLVQRWNDCNQPSLSPHELRTTFASAVRGAKHPPGGKLTERPGTVVTEWPATRDHQAVSFTRLTAAELDAGHYELEYLIDGTLTAGQPHILAGARKSLKTNIALDACISIASGLPFLGRLDVLRPARTAIMSGESGLPTIQETCRRICDAKGTRLRDVTGLIFSPDLPRIDNQAHLAALADFIRNDEIEVLALDPMYLTMPGDDAGNLFKTGELLRGLTKVCSDAGVTLIMAHHTRKNNLGDPFSPPELEHIAWAGFQEYARQWWLLSRRESYQPGSGQHRLWFSVGGSAGHSSLWALNIAEGVYDGFTPRVWNVELLTAGDARDSAKQHQAEQRKLNAQAKFTSQVESDKQAIEDALRGVPGHVETKSVIEARSGRSGKAFNEAMAHLLRAGKLNSATIKRANGQEYPAFAMRFDLAV